MQQLSKKCELAFQHALSQIFTSAPHVATATGTGPPGSDGPMWNAEGQECQ